MAPMKETFPSFDWKEGEKEVAQFSVARGILCSIYSEFQGRQMVLPLHHSQSGTCPKPSGRSSWERTLDWNPGAYGPSTHPFRQNSMCGIFGHPLPAGQGLGQRDLPLGSWCLGLFWACPSLLGRGRGRRVELSGSLQLSHSSSLLKF